MLIGPGTASASIAPFRFINVQVLPSTVSPGADAGYKFTIQNNGTSNIAQLFLTAPSNGVPAYFSNSRGTVCQLSPSLKCSFGALNAGDTIDVTVAYDTTGFASPFTATFLLDTTGGASTDPHKSHGDSVRLDVSTTLNSDPNFAGGFQLTGSQVGTTGTLSKRNDQTSSVNPKVGSTLVPVTIEDGLPGFPGAGTDPCATSTTFKCLGDWTQVRVGNGTPSDGPIKVTLLLYGPSVPGGATLDTIGLWHQDSTPNPITLRCSDLSSIPSGGANECVTVSFVGKNIQIVAWLLHNGGLHGTF